MELLYAVSMGIGLSACCGFRVFVPLFISSLLSNYANIDIMPGFDWMHTNTAIITFGVASVAEILGYYIPFVDNILDLIVAPLSVIAGTLLTASLFTEMPGILQWVLGLIVGGGTAGVIQVGTTMARLTSTGATAGLGNPIVATIENVLAAVTTILALFIPVFIAIIIVITVIWLCNKYIFQSKPTTARF